MSAIAVPRNSDQDMRWLGLWREAEPGLFGLGVVMLIALAPTGFAALVDPRTFLGEGNWVKPLKFELALAVYLMTLAFFAHWLPAGTRDRRWYRIYRNLVIVAIVVEMIWIAAAAALGVASHFNRSPLGAAIYSSMGVGAVILTTPTAVYAWLIARNRSAGLRPEIKESIAIGLALVLPLTLITAGTMSSMDGHSIGGSGAAGGAFPLMGWSRDGGDLRVAHFFATHALHFIPAFALISAVLLKSTSRWPIRLFAAFFVVLVAWTFAEALRGNPFLPAVGSETAVSWR